ncbi:MAG: HYR domain-containing protein [Anaerolineales bacterium]
MVPPIQIQPPTLNVPNDITVEATSSSGSVVTFSITASDAEDNPDPTPVCNHASGSLFPIATTTVICSVTNSWGVVMSDSFTVRVRDTAGPVLSLPANITAEATGSNGRAVTFTATAIDLVDGPRTVTCFPGTGSTFSIGTTTVNCWSFDSRVNFSTGSFTITVRDTTPPTLKSPSQHHCGSYRSFWQSCHVYSHSD